MGRKRVNAPRDWNVLAVARRAQRGSALGAPEGEGASGVTARRSCAAARSSITSTAATTMTVPIQDGACRRFRG